MIKKHLFFPKFFIVLEKYLERAKWAGFFHPRCSWPLAISVMYEVDEKHNFFIFFYYK